MKPSQIKRRRDGSTLHRIVNQAFQFFGPIGAMFVILVGTWGYALCGASDPIYKAVQFFALAYDTGCTPASWQLNVARFFAAFLLALAVIRLLFAHPWNRLKIWSQAAFRARSRHILIGHGALNEEIARYLSTEGRPLTVLARNFDQASRSFAAKYRIILVERDARDERAFDGLLLHRADKVIVACGDDSLTLELAQQIGSRIAAARDRDSMGRIRKKLFDRLERKAKEDPGFLQGLAAWLSDYFSIPAPEEMVFAHFTSTAMHHQLQMTREAGLERERQFTGFAIREETARQFFARTWLAERAALSADGTAQKPRLHVVVVGGGDLGMAIAREAMLHGCCSKLGAPLITVIDRDRKSCRQRFISAMPHIFDGTIPEQDRPEIIFLSAQAEDLCTNPWTEDQQTPEGSGQKDTWRADVPVTGWVICCTDDTTNMALAMQLEREMLSGRRPPCPIFPRQWQSNVRAQSGRLIGQDDPVHLVAPFGGMQDVVPSLSFFDEQLPRLAQSIHAQYQDAAGKNYEKTGLDQLLGAYGAPPWDNDTGPADPEERAKIAQIYELEWQKYKAEWSGLSDEGRLSNLSSAHYAALRLWELGYDWSGRYSGALPRLNRDYISEIVSDRKLAVLSPDTLLGQASEAEHRRWMVERALRGWSAAQEGKRNNALRLHPDFRPYRELFDAAKAEKNAVDQHNRENNLEGDARKVMNETNLRRLDAAAVHGILNALSLSGETVQARPQREHATLDLFDLPDLNNEMYQLVLRVPLVKKWDDDAGKDKKKALETSVSKIREWMKYSTSLCLTVQAESPEVWTDLSFKKMFEPVVDAARPNKDRKYPVHIVVNHEDVSKRRGDTARPEKKKTS